MYGKAVVQLCGDIEPGIVLMESDLPGMDAIVVANFSLGLSRQSRDRAHGLCRQHSVNDALDRDFSTFLSKGMSIKGLRM